jgi:hypothetical protein
MIETISADCSTKNKQRQENPCCGQRNGREEVCAPRNLERASGFDPEKIIKISVGKADFLRSC